MAPTAAMLILGHQTRPISKASHSQSSTSASIFLLKASLAKWVSNCSFIFQRGSKEMESIVDLSSPLQESKVRYQEKSSKSAVDDRTVAR